MRIAFIDALGWDYNVETPLTQPLGGSESALCYLTTELARLGHEISLINGIAVPGNYAGVQCINQNQGMDSDLLNRSDVVVVKNAGNAGMKLRQSGIRVPLVLWSHHRFDQPAVKKLHHKQEVDSWSGFAFVSQWAAAEYIRHFGLPPERCRVLHNGVGRPFAERQLEDPWFLGGSPPVLAYTSSPNRGLDILLNAFPIMQEAFPNIGLRIYSSMSIYRVPPEQDQFVELYQRGRAMLGVAYNEPIGQLQLARELASVAALAYPCTVPETFCLAAAEAMAVGALLVTTPLGAPAELFAKFANMVELVPGMTYRMLSESFARLVITLLESDMRDPKAAIARRNAQIEFVRTNFAWPKIAPQWIAWLENLIGRPGNSLPTRGYV